MTFEIVAGEAEKRKPETRRSAASAAVLAMKWSTEGAKGVGILIGGQKYGGEEFRKRFLNSPRGPYLVNSF